MGITLNPFTGLLEVTGGGGSDPHFHNPVATEGDLPGSGLSGEMIVVEATDRIYIYDTSLSKWVDTGITAAAAGSSPNSDGYSLTVDSSGAIVRNEIVLQPADATHPGVISTTTQTIAGQKTLNSTPILNTLSANTAIYVDSSKQIQSSGTTNTELGYVSGVTSAIQTQLDSKIPLSQKGANSGVATLDSGGKVPLSQLPASILEYQGTWNASNNTPTLADGTGTSGFTYRVNVAGTQNLGNGSLTFVVGDWAIYDGAHWQLAHAGADAVVSVNGQAGVVTLTTDNVSEGSSNLYFTSGRAQSAVTGAASTITTSNLTVDRALISDGSGKVAISAVTDTELGYVSGVTSSIQTQLDDRVLKSGDTMSGALDMAHNNINNIGTANFTSGSNNNSSVVTANNIVAFRDDGITNSVSYFYSVVPSDSDLLSQAMLIEAYSITTSDTIDIGIAGKDIHLGTEGVIDLDTYSYGPNTLVNYGRIENSSNSVLITAATGDLKLTSTSGQVKSLKDLSMETHQIHNVVDPTSAQDAATKHYVDIKIGAGPGDITPSSFSFANNQASAADVTGLSFANASVGNFKAFLGVKLLATSSLYGTLVLVGTQKGSGWDLSYTFEGDDTGLVFSITSAGQVQYQSPDSTGFSSGTIKFSAITLSF